MAQYPPYILNFILGDDPSSGVLPNAKLPTSGPGTAEAIAEVAHKRVLEGKRVEIKGSHTLAMSSAHGIIDVFVSHDNQASNTTPTINVVLRSR